MYGSLHPSSAVTLTIFTPVSQQGTTIVALNSMYTVVLDSSQPSNQMTIFSFPLISIGSKVELFISYLRKSGNLSIIVTLNNLFSPLLLTAILNRILPENKVDTLTSSTQSLPFHTFLSISKGSSGSSSVTFTIAVALPK